MVNKISIVIVSTRTIRIKNDKILAKKNKSNLIKQFNIKNLKNLGSTEDVANIILFLSSKRSKLIQGAEINANGGIII